MALADVTVIRVKRAIDDRCPDLKHQVSTSWRPAHLLLRPGALEVPTVVRIDRKTRRRSDSSDKAKAAPAESKSAIVSTRRKRAGASAAPPANDDPKPPRIDALHRVMLVNEIAGGLER
jgi:hypothetical protein